MERVLDVTMARRKLGTLLDEVYHRGDVVTIERKGKPLAKIVPMETSTTYVTGRRLSKEEQARLLTRLNNLPVVDLGEDPVKLLRRMRDAKERAARDEYGR